MSIDKEALKKAPGFDKDRWPSMADLHWAEQVYTYYTVDRYWR